MTMDARGRLTVPDILWILMSLAFVAVLWPIVWDGLQQHASNIGTGTLLLFRLVLPIALLVLLAMIYRKAVGGGV